ncbi:MAG: phosphate-binding protein, partial [Anaerolineae bacterium]
MKSRLNLLLVLLAVLALGLAACGGGAQQATPTEAPAAAATEA